MRTLHRSVSRFLPSLAILRYLEQESLGAQWAPSTSYSSTKNLAITKQRVRAFTWWGNQTWFHTYLPPNATQPDVVELANYCVNTWPNPPCTAPHTTAMPMTSAARSRHVGGVNTGLCDGSLRFVTNTIAIDVWRGLGTTQGGELLGPY